MCVPPPPKFRNSGVIIFKFYIRIISVQDESVSDCASPQPAYNGARREKSTGKSLSTVNIFLFGSIQEVTKRYFVAPPKFYI